LVRPVDRVIVLAVLGLIQQEQAQTPELRPVVRPGEDRNDFIRLSSPAQLSGGCALSSGRARTATTSRRSN
jgi:hypothetical protein